MRLIDRFGQWSEIQKVRPTGESPDMTGGRDAELLLKQLVGSSFQFKDAHVFSGRRIPSRRQGRRREIDLIVCTPRMVHLIEVKNWSGRLDVRDGVWRQYRRSGDVVDHRDLLETNRYKRDAVAEYLNDRGVALDERFVRDRIVPKVIFMNARLELDPAIEALPEVISRRELEGFLGRQRQKRFADRMFSSFIDFCTEWESKLGGDRSRATSEQIPTGQYQRIVACLSETGTWDQLRFHGAKVVTGDLIRLVVGAKSYRKDELVEMAGGLPIRLRWTRGRFWGFLKALTGLGPLGSLQLGKTSLEISPSDTVTFHAVGEAEPSPRRLVELDRIVLG